MITLRVLLTGALFCWTLWGSAFGYDNEVVHRYLTSQSLELLKKKEMSSITNKIAEENARYGAFHEDEVDVVFHYADSFLGATYGQYRTHFWDADAGDTGTGGWIKEKAANLVNPIPDADGPSAWEKARVLWEGWYDVVLEYDTTKNGQSVHLGVSFYGGQTRAGAETLSVALAQSFALTNKEATNVQARILSNPPVAGKLLPGMEGLKTLAEGGDTGLLGERLGRIAHYLQDATVPAHAHRDPHPGQVHHGYDDPYEDWIYSNGGLPQDPPFFGSGQNGRDNHDRYNADHAVADGGLVVIPWEKVPSDIPRGLFPLYYLLYTANQTADYFASKGFITSSGGLFGADGDSTDRRGWMDYSSFPSRPRKSQQLDNNDHKHIFNPLPFFTTILDDDNNDNDNDLDLIMSKCYVYAIRAVSTLFRYAVEGKDFYSGPSVTASAPTATGQRSFALAPGAAGFDPLRTVFPEVGNHVRGAIPLTVSIAAGLPAIDHAEFRWSTDGGHPWGAYRTAGKIARDSNGIETWRADWNSAADGLHDAQMVQVQWRATNVVGTVKEGGTSGVFTIDNTLPTVAFSAAPFDKPKNAFSAKINDKIKLTYQVGDNLSETVTTEVDVLNADGAVVQTIRQVGRPLGPLTDIWDGHTKYGLIADDGIYRMRVRVLDKAGNETVQMALGEIILDNTAPQLLGTGASPAFFTPELETKKSSTLFVAVRDNFDKQLPGATLTVEVRDRSRTNLVRAYVSATNTPIPYGTPGPFEWDGAGVLDGRYNFRVFVKDFVGNTREVFYPIVRGNVPVVITEPEPMASVTGGDSGLVPMRGEGVDVLGFVAYTLWFAPGVEEKLRPESDWVPIVVPASQQAQIDPVFPNSNRSVLPIQNNGVLANLDTRPLQDGDYTLRLRVLGTEGRVRDGFQHVTLTNQVYVLNARATSAVLRGKPGEPQASVTFDFELTRGADSRLEVKDANGTTFSVASGFRGASVPGAPHQIEWDGVVNGQPLAAGRYTWRIVAVQPGVVRMGPVVSPELIIVDPTATPSATISVPANSQGWADTAVQGNRRVVAVTGQVGGVGVPSWRLDVTRAPPPEQWTPVASGVGAILSGGSLGAWDVTGLEDGSYLLALTVLRAGTAPTQVLQPVVLNDPMKISDVSSSISPASPSLPNTLDPTFQTATIRFTLSDRAQATVQVSEAGGGAVVATLVDKQMLDPGPHQVLWGKGVQGGQVVPGNYKIAITATDPRVANDQDVKFTDTLAVGDQPLTIIGTPSVDPQAITPADGNGVKDEAIVVYQLSRPASMRLAVSQAGQEVRQVSQEAVMGTNEIRWNGRDTNGALVAPGQYVLTLRSADGKTAQDVGSVVVEAVTSNMVGRIDSPQPDVPGGSVLADRNLSKAGTFFNWRARGSGTYYPSVYASYQWRGRFNNPVTLGRWCVGGGFGVTSVSNVPYQWPFTRADTFAGLPSPVYEPGSLPNPGEAFSGPFQLEGNNGGTASASLDSRGVLNIRYSIPGSFFTERCLKVSFNYFRLIESGVGTVVFPKRVRNGFSESFVDQSVNLGDNPYEIVHPDGGLRLVGQSGQVSVSGGGRGPYALTTNEERPGTGFPRDGREIVSPRPVRLLFDFLDPEKPVETLLNIYQPYGGPEPMPADHDVSNWNGTIFANRADNGGPDPNVQFFVGASGTNLQAAANPHLGQFVARLLLKPEKKFLEFHGAAGGQGFAKYQLEFSSAGVVPEKWTVIKESGQSVSGVGEDVLLGFWDITGRFGDFVVALSVTNTSGQVQESRLRVTIGDEVKQGTLSWVGTPFLDTTAIFPPDSLQVEKAVVGITPVNPNESLPNAPGGKTILDAVVKAGLVLAGPVLDLHPVEPPEGLKFNPNRPVALVYKYEDAPGVNPAQLGIYRIKPDGTVKFMDGLVDEINKTITVDLDSFSLYAAGVDPSRPKSPVVEPLVAQTSGSSITIRGTAEVSRLVASVPLPPSRVVVTLNDRPAGEVALAVPEGVFPPTTAPFELPTVPLDEGLNVIKVVVVNPRGLQSVPIVHRVIRDSQPPRVIEVVALPSPTIGLPGDHGDGGQVTLRALMDEAGLGRWTIENAAGITVLAQDVLTVNLGGVFASQLVWDGRDSVGQPVPDGTYTVTFHGQDAIGNPAAPALVSPLTLLVDRTPPQVKSWVADRAAFGGPGAPRVTFTAAIEDASVGVDGVFAVILGPDGKAIASPLPATRTADGAFRFVWDGSGPQGDLPEGAYPVEVDAVDRAGNLTRSSPVTVSFQRKRILDAQAALAQPLAVSPNGDGIQDTLEVGLTLLAPARVQARVEGAGFQAQILPPIDLEAGAQSVRWTATNASGQPVPDGMYVMVLQAQTADGQADEVRLPVEVDTVAPEVTVAVPVANQVVSGAVPVRGAIKEAGAGLLQYRVNVKGSDPIAEPTVAFSTNAPVGNLLAVWESTPGAGPVEIRVTAQDRAGNVTVVAVPVQLANPDFLVFQTTVTGALVFSPDGDGHDDQVTLPFAVLEHTAKLQAQVVTVAGVPIRSLLPETVLSEGPFEVVWDGRPDAPGQPVVTDGEYQIEVRGEVDPAPETPALTAPVVVVRRYPVLVVTGRPQVTISAPVVGATVAGMMEVTGSVSDPTGGRYEVRLGTISGTGIVVGQGTVSTAGSLARVDTRLVRDGPAWLTIRVFNAAGADASQIVPVTVLNDTLDVTLETPQAGAVVGGTVSLTGRVHPTVTGTYALAFTRGTITDAGDANVTWSPVAEGAVSGTFTTTWDTRQDLQTLVAQPWPFGAFEGSDTSPLRFPGWTVGEPTIITSGDGFARAELVRGSGLGPVAEGQEALGLLVEAGNCCGVAHEASGAIAAESDPFSPVGTPFTLAARLVQTALPPPDFAQVTVAARFEVVDLTSQQTVTYQTETALQGETWTTLTVPMTNHAGHSVKFRVSVEETSQGPVTQEGFSSIAVLLVDAVKGDVLVPAAIEGPVTLRLRATSADGRPATVLHPLVVDNTPPTVVLNAPTAASGVRGVVALNGKIADPHLTKTSAVFVSGGGAAPVGLPPLGADGDFAGFWDTESLDGAGVLRIQATDAAGNVSTLERSVVAENHRPHLQVVNPVNSQRVHGTVGVQAEAAGPGLADLVLLAGQDHDHLTVLKTVAAVSDAAQLLFNWDTQTQPEGLALVEIRARDARGEVVDRRTIFVVVDNQPPTLKDPVLTPPGFNPLQTVNNQQRITATLTEPAVVGVDIRSADGATLVRSLRAPTFASAGRLAVTWDGRDNSRRLAPVGAYRVVMRATDLVGQASELVVPTRIGVDDVPPVTQAVPEGAAVIIAGQLTGNLSTRMVLNAEDPVTSAAVSGVKEIRVAVDGEAFRTYVIPIAFTSSGLHSVMFQAVDQAGNMEVPKTVTINIDATGPALFRAERIRIEAEALSNQLTNLVRTPSGVALPSAAEVIPGGVPNGGFEQLTNDPAQPFVGWHFFATPEQGAGFGFDTVGRGSLSPNGVLPGAGKESVRLSSVVGPEFLSGLFSDSFVWPGGTLQGFVRGHATSLAVAVQAVQGPQQVRQSVSVEEDWKPFVINLAAFAGKQVTISFEYEALSSESELFVDELVALRFPAIGVVQTAALEFPHPVRFVNFRAGGTTENGTVTHEFSLDGQTWRSIAVLETVEATQVRFRATLARTNLDMQATPTLDFVQVDSVRPLALDAAVLPPGPQELKVVASEPLQTLPMLQVKFRDGSVETGTLTASEDEFFTFAYGVPVETAARWGRATLSITGQDLVGNLGTSATGFFVRDATPPQTTLVPSESLVTVEGRMLLRSDVSLGFQAADPVVNGFAAGVAETRAGLQSEGATGVPRLQAVSQPMSIPFEGRFTLQFQSEDLAGNVEPRQAVKLEVDNTVPTFAGTRNRRVEAEAAGATLVNLTRVNGAVRPRTKTLGPVPNGDFEASPFLDRWTLVSGSAEPGGTSPDRVFDGIQSVLLRGGLDGSATPPVALRSAPFVFGSVQGVLRVHVQPLTSFVDFAALIGERPEEVGSGVITLTVIDVETGVRTILLNTSLGEPSAGNWGEYLVDASQFQGRQIQMEFTVATQSGFPNAPVSEVLVDAVQDGQFVFAYPTASLLTDWVSLSAQATGLQHFHAFQTIVNGTIQHFFSTDGATFRPVSDLAQADVSSRRIRFRSDITIADLTQLEGPVLDAVTFEEVLSPRVSLAEAKTGDTVQMAFPVSEVLRSTPTVTLAVADGSSRLASFTTQAGLDFTYAYTVQPKDPNGLATIKIAATDRAGNVGQDTSLTVRVLTDDVPPVVLFTPTTALLAVEADAFVTTTTVRVQAIDASRVRFRQDFNDLADGAHPPAWSPVTGDWQVVNHTFQGTAGGPNNEPVVFRALSTVDGVGDALYQAAILPVTDDTTEISGALLFRVKDVKPLPDGQNVGLSGYAVRLVLAAQGLGQAISLEREDAGQITVLAKGDLPQPVEPVPGTHGRVPITVLARGPHLQVFVKGVGVLDAMDATYAAGQVGLEARSVGEGDAVMRFDDIQVLDLEGASGVAHLVATVASDTQTVAVDSDTVDLALITEGRHTITVTATDRAGNVSPPTVMVVVVDTTPPTFTVSAASPPFVHAGRVSFPVRSSERLLGGGPEVRVNGRRPDALFDTLVSTVLYTVTGADPEGPAVVTVTGRDFAGNVGRLTTTGAFVVDRSTPITLATPDTDLYPDGTDTFSRPVTFTLTAIDPGRELVKFDFNDPTLQGQPDPRWRVLSGAWTVEDQAYRGLAGINEENPTIQALSVTDHFTDYVLQFNLEDELPQRDTSAGVLVRVQEAVPEQVTGGYAVTVTLSSHEISLWKLTGPGPTGHVRLATARLPQPALVARTGFRARVPVTMVVQGHRIRVAPFGVVVLDVTDPDGPLNGHLGVEVSAADEGSHAARFDHIRLLDLSDLTVASGVTAVETTVASTPETVLTPGTSVTVTITEPGAHTLTYHAVDAAGNAEPSRTVAVVVDTVPPTLALTQTTPEFVAAGAVTMRVTASEPLRLDPVATVNGRAASAGVSEPPSVGVGYRVTAADAEGVATLVLQARDRAGNATTLTVPAFEVDRTPPAVGLQTPRLAVLNPAGPPGVSETVRLPAVVSEPGTYQVTLVGPAGGTLRTLPAVSMAGGPVEVSWDGKTDQGLLLDTTGVSWKAVVEDRAGNRTEIDAARAGVAGVGLDVRQPILTNLALPPTVSADVSDVLVRYALHLPQGGVVPVRLTVLSSTGGVVRTVLPRADDPGLRGGGVLVERWDGRDGAGHALAPGAYWVLAEAGGEDAAPTPTRANPVLRAFAVTASGSGAVESGSVTVVVPGTTAGITVSSAPPRSWPVLAAQALRADGAGRVTIGGVRPEGEVRLLQAATDVLTTLLPAGPAVHIEPDAGLPMGTVLVAALPAPVEPDQVGLYRYDGTAWLAVAEQTVSPAEDGAARLVARLEQGGLYAVLRPTDTVAPVVGALSAPLAFSPNTDGRMDSLPVAQTTTDGVYRLLPRETLTVTDAQGQGVVRQAATRPLGAATVVWTGLDAAGRAVPEGRYTWALEAQDAWGNTSAAMSSATLVDLTPPTPQFSVASPSSVVNGQIFSQPGSLMTGTGTDPLSGGVASGVREVRLTLDRPATTVVGGQEAAPTRPMVEGQRTFTLTVEDVAGNLATQTLALAVDGTAPQTVFTTSGPFVNDVYVSTATRIQLTATDALAGTPPVAAGVTSLAYTIDLASVTVSSTAAFQLQEGVRFLTWQAVDAVQNQESLQTRTLRVDGTPPRTALVPSRPFVVVGSQPFAQPDVTYTFTAADPDIALGIPGSGVVAIRYQVDGSSWQVWGSTPFVLAEGLRTVTFYSQDAVANAEAVQTLTIAVDGTPPATISTIGDPQDPFRTTPPHAAHPLVLVSSQTPITLSALDPLAGAPPVAAGVAALSFRITSSGTAPGSFTVASTTTVILQLAGRSDGDYLVDYQAQDALPNVESLKTLSVTLDATPPVVQLLSPAPENFGVCQVVKGTIPVVATITDRYLATYRLEVAAGANATNGFTTLVDAGLGPTGPIATPVTAGALTVWDTRGLTGWQTVRLIATDLVQHQTRVVLNIFVGDPALTQTLGASFKSSEKDDVDDLDHPEGVAIAPDGTRWVADSEHDRLLAFSTGAVLLRVVTGFHEPQGIAVLSDNSALWVADRENSRLVKLTPLGQILQTVGRVNTQGKPQAGSLPGEFNHPGQVAVDGQGRIYVADRNNQRWQRLKADGTPDLVVTLPRVPEVDDGGEEDDPGKKGGELEETEPFGIAVTTDAGRVYVSEEESGQVLIYQVTDTTATLSGTLGGGLGTFKKPQGLATTRQNHVYVAERNANQVRKYDRFGTLVLVFGTQPGPNQEEGDDDEKGKKMAADPLRLFKPTALAVGPNGELAVAVRNDDGVKIFDAPISTTPPPAPPRAVIARQAPDLSALGPPHDFSVGPNPARAGAPVNVYFVTGWSNFETEVRVYTAAGEPVSTSGGAGPVDGGAPARSVPWGSPAYAPGRYAVSWAPRQESGGEPLASGVYLIQLKVRNPDTGEVVPTLKKVLVIR